MKDNRQVLGSSGEDQALLFLQRKGFVLVRRNLKLFCGEIDLLMRDPQARNSLVIVEVKTKSSQDFGLAADMITLKKKRKLLQLAHALWQKFPSQTIRIDVVAIDGENISHWASAVEEN